MKLRYDADELLASHPYVETLTAVGRRLHGGLDADGRYQTPRTLNRWRAVETWQRQSESRGWPFVEVSPSILGAEIYPSLEQQEMLLESGFGQILWNALTWTGITESKAAPLISIPVPDFQTLVEDDLSDTLTSHLTKGLLAAHGMDEAGDPATPEIGAHDIMWFMVRDLALGKDAFPTAPPLPPMFRPVRREMPDIPPEFEYFIKYMMNVLMLEVRAQVFFDYCRTLLGNPLNFPERRSDADHASEIVGRIATDELIHIAYLRVFISELRGFRFHSLSRGLVTGASILDPAWRKMVQWHANFENKYADLRREQAESQIREAAGQCGELVLARFRALEARPLPLPA